MGDAMVTVTTFEGFSFTCEWTEDEMKSALALDRAGAVILIPIISKNISTIHVSVKQIRSWSAQKERQSVRCFDGT